MAVESDGACVAVDAAEEAPEEAGLSLPPQAARVSAAMAAKSTAIRLIPGDTRARTPGSGQFRAQDVVRLDLPVGEVGTAHDADLVVLALLDRGGEDHVGVALGVHAEGAR